jgi:hypothetical protein
MIDSSELLNRLYEARYSGVLRVRQGDRDVTYHSPAELEEAIKSLEARIAGKNRQVYHFTPAMRRD